MENYVAGQLAALGTAVALGAAGGLIYDLLRVLRRRRPGLTHAADAVFGLVCLLGTLWALSRSCICCWEPGRGCCCICWRRRRCCGPCGSSGPMRPGSWRGWWACPWGFLAGWEKNCCQK